MTHLTRGQLEEIQAGVFVPEPVTITFDGTGNNGKVSTAAALTTALTGTNNDIVYTADAAGLAGNDITIEYNSTNREPGQSAAVCHTSGNAITVDLKTSAGVKATATLTSSGVFQDAETVTIDEVEYTFKTALSTGPTVAYEVLIGATAAASLDNLKSAVNLTAGIGTTYSTGTEIHPTVTATTNADDSQVFEAKTLGAAGNLIASTETTANNAFGDTVFAGGEDINQVLSTADEVKTAVEADTAAAALVGVADAGGNDGSGVVTVMAATNLTGGSDGTVDLFTVEDDGLIAILGDCSVDLTGASATLEVGVTGNTAALIPQTTATTLDQNERIDRTGVIATSTAPNVTPFFPVRAGTVIQLKVGTATITAGTVDWQLYYKAFDALGGTANPFTFTESRPGTSAVTSVNDTATSTTLIAANTSARERIIQNDSTSTLYVKFGTTASATDYTTKLAQDDVLTTEYTGRIDGIWSSDASGAAKITELT